MNAGQHVKNIIKKIFAFRRSSRHQSIASATIIPRAQHAISRQLISKNALKVLYHLHKNNYSAYLVGGCLRDLLLGQQPKDFDVATDAKPEQIKSIFRNCRLIGRRFRLAHIHFRGETIEVATFRATHQSTASQRSYNQEGMIMRDNVYGSITEDALRRDFTINALYYNIADFSIVDFADGLEDLASKTIRLIGHPETRYQEDPIRILRAIRFAGKLGFAIDSNTAKPISSLKHNLEKVSPSRIFLEIEKLFLTGSATSTLKLLMEYELLSILFPPLTSLLQDEQKNIVLKLIYLQMQQTDVRISAGKPITASFLFSAILWYPLQSYQVSFESDGLFPYQALEKAISQVIREQCIRIALPKVCHNIMREIWILQYRLQRRQRRQVLRLLQHQRYHAAYDFLCLRCEVEPELLDIANWWQQLQNTPSKERKNFIADKNNKSQPKNRPTRNKASAS